MKVVDLVKDGIPTKLKHPTVGTVSWGEPMGPGSGYILYFSGGVDKHKPLVVDNTVLHDDQWEPLGQ